MTQTREDFSFVRMSFLPLPGSRHPDHDHMRALLDLGRGRFVAFSKLTQRLKILSALRVARMNASSLSRAVEEGHASSTAHARFAPVHFLHGLTLDFPTLANEPFQERFGKLRPALCGNNAGRDLL